jgi:glycosyltransferase involved in cell wall biosynthesis
MTRGFHSANSPSLWRVVVINDDCVESGGAASIAITSARLLRQRGLAVSFLTGGRENSAGLEQLGVDVISVGGQNIMDGARGAAAIRGIFDRRTSAGVRQWIADHDTPATVYHLHNWHKTLSPSVFQPLKQVQNRLYMSAHDYFLACPNGGYFLYPQHSACELTPASMRCILTSCDRRHYGHKLWRVARHQTRRSLFDITDTDALVLAVHEGMVPYLVRGGIASSRVRVLRNPVTRWRTVRVPAEQNRDVFFIGRLEADKGVDLLARAAQRAQVRLRIIGNGPLADSLRRDNPDVELLGWRSRDEIAALIGEARLVVVPTRWRETFGLVALEALMSGIPVIASRFSLISEEIVANGFGAACDPHDEPEFAAVLQALVHDDNQIENMSRRSFAKAGGLAPSPEKWCDDLIGLYEQRIFASRTRQVDRAPHPANPDGRQ